MNDLSTILLNHQNENLQMKGKLLQSKDLETTMKLNNKNLKIRQSTVPKWQADEQNRQAWVEKKLPIQRQKHTHTSPSPLLR